MSDLIQTPPAAYWNCIRQSEAKIFEQSQQTSPLFYAEAAVAAWRTGSADGVDDFDTLAYSGITPIGLWRSRKAILTNFNQPSPQEGERAKSREARLFELMLEPRREKLLVYAAWLPLARHGLIPDSMPGMERGKKLYQQFDFITPTDDDYAFVKDQLSRGASGGYAIDISTGSEY